MRQRRGRSSAGAVPPPPTDILETLQDRLLGSLVYTADEVIAASGTDLSEAGALWTNLGFPHVPPAARLFTERDREALASAVALWTAGLVAPDATRAVTRVLGQALSRVAASQVEALADRLRAALETVENSADVDRVTALVTDILVPSFERFVTYAWRRHLVAAIQRELVDRRQGTEIVGFADLVDYTRETRDLPGADLTHLIDRFEHAVYERVVAHRGRILKVMGDGVMFVMPTPDTAAHAALGLVAACATDDALLRVRVGLASGPVVALEGDLFGETVNRASRLAGEARPQTVLADETTGAALVAHGGFEMRHLRPRHLKGLGEVGLWVVRAANPGR